MRLAETFAIAIAIYLSAVVMIGGVTYAIITGHGWVVLVILFLIVWGAIHELNNAIDEPRQSYEEPRL